MLPGKQNRKSPSDSTNDSKTKQRAEPTSGPSSLLAGLLRQSLASPGDSSPQALRLLQRQVGNRAVNRMLASRPDNPAPIQPVITPRPSISRVSRVVIQREISDKTFSERAATYGYRNLSPQLVTGLVQIVNTIIRKYPAHEKLILDNFDDVLMHIVPAWPVTSHVRSFVQALAKILTDQGGLDKFEAPPEVWDIGRVQQPPPLQYDDDDDDDTISTVDDNDRDDDNDDDGFEVPEIQGEIDPEDLAGEQGLPQELGAAQAGVIPVGHRLTAKLTMGQGLVANLGQLILFSDEFSSCSPIVLYNQHTHMGGLFHFPAGAFEEQSDNLRQMYLRVLPTHVYLNNRGRIDEVRGTMSTDHIGLQGFFENDLGFDGQIQMIALRSPSYAVTLAPNGLDVNIGLDASAVGGGGAGGSLDVFRDRTGGGRREVAHNWQHAPAATKFGRDDWHT